MALDKVSPGKNAPHEFNVIIEIPMNADPGHGLRLIGVRCGLFRRVCVLSTCIGSDKVI